VNTHGDGSALTTTRIGSGFRALRSAKPRKDERCGTPPSFRGRPKAWARNPEPLSFMSTHGERSALVITRTGSGFRALRSAKPRKDGWGSQPCASCRKHRLL